MVLSDENIRAFQALHKEQFGRDINKEEAYAQGTKLLQLMSIIYRPITRKDFENSEARQADFLREQK